MTTNQTRGDVRVRLRTGAWHEDAGIDLAFPPGWDVHVHRPRTPAPLTLHDISAAVRNPLAGPPLHELAVGMHRVAILVDDLTRPTPAAAILPSIFTELVAAGVPASAVTILLATGAHGGRVGEEALRAKLGAETMDRCRVVVHDHRAATTYLGVTTYGTPVHLDCEIAGSDLVVGVGGVYPQHTVGFGGGAKIVLGALGTRSIAALHYGHPSGRGSYDVDNDFRRDVGEMAGMAGLRFGVLAHVDAQRALVRVVAGEPVTLHGAEADYARRTYLAPGPGDADLVVANAYPMDVSLTFAMSKGAIPLHHARPGATRVLVARCAEGLGRHDLFPLAPGPLDRLRQLRRKVSADPAAAPGKAISSLRRRLTAGEGHESAARPPILWYPGRPADCSGVRGLVPVDRWADVLDRAAEGGGRTAVVYPCAPLQVLDLD